MSNLISVVLNGVEYRVEKGFSLFAFLSHQKIETQGCALAIEQQVIPRSEWQQRGLSDGESISLFQAIAGG
ncbi:sulfur carrier protein ThiS [uncultured Aliivibrio sp.]|uniref:sulfur carrier protein ThiS n=1 Tax=uncultured Aliivibrio sp. TaxID=873085 RepID=UPI00261938E7|nr:sulfur carrier protein ThiS [uncultured Aliivibrio sp.]